MKTLNTTKFKETSIGYIPQDWNIAKISDVTEKVAIGPFGSSIKVETFVNHGVPVISGQHLRGIKLEDSDYNFIKPEHAEKLRNSIVFRDDVVFTHAGNIGQVAYIPKTSKYDRYIISQRQFYLRCDKEKLMPDFITYFFKTPIGQHTLLSNKSQTGVPSIAQPVNHLRKIEIPLPALSEQEQIAEVLSSLDDMIELNQKINTNLEKLGGSIFKKWFSSSGDKLPQNWRVGTFGEAVTNFDSKRIPLSSMERDKRRGSYPYYGATSIMDYVDGFIFDGTYVLLGEDGSVVRDNGKPFVQYVSGKIWVNNHAHVLQGKNGFSTEYIKLFLDQVDILPFVTGAVQPKINQANMNSIPMVIPDPKTLDRFNSIAASIFGIILENESENRNLEQLRDSLLPRLMNGKIRVPVNQ